MTSLRGSGRTLHQLPAVLAGADPDRRAITFLGQRSFTRGELAAAVVDRAGRLRGAGVGRGDRVCLLLGNGPEFLVNLLALSSLGAVTVPVNVAYRGSALSATLAQMAPCRVITDASFAAHLASVVDEGVAVTDRWFVDDPDWPPHYAAGSEVDVQPWDPAVILLTSGTTALAKGVVWSHNMAVTFAEHTTWVMGYDERDVIYTCLPMFHINALFCAVYAGLVTGAEVVVAQRFSASRFWHDVADSGATVTNMMGSIPAVLWRRPVDEIEIAHRLRLAMVLPLPADRAAFEARFGLSTTEVYGSTDTAMPLGIPFGASRPGSCGVPTPGWAVQLVDDDDEPVADGVAGELVTRPEVPFIGQSGYWGFPKLSWKSMRNQWFHTGDLLRRDSDGWYYYIDRKKDVVRVSGENVSSVAVEQALLSHPEVAEAAVFGMPSELGEESVAAAVVLRPGSSVAPAQMRDHVASGLPYFAVPRYIAVRDHLPKTATEKVRKADLRDPASLPSFSDGGRPRRPGVLPSDGPASGPRDSGTQ